jgi:hypothetical protein
VEGRTRPRLQAELETHVRRTINELSSDMGSSHDSLATWHRSTSWIDGQLSVPCSENVLTNDVQIFCPCPSLVVNGRTPTSFFLHAGQADEVKTRTTETSDSSAHVSRRNLQLYCREAPPKESVVRLQHDAAAERWTELNLSSVGNWHRELDAARLRPKAPQTESRQLFVSDFLCGGELVPGRHAEQN